MKLFLQKNAKFSSAGGSGPRPPKQPPPLHIPGYAPGAADVRHLGVIDRILIASIPYGHRVDKWSSG